MAGEHDFEGRAIIDLETGQIDEDLTGYVGELTRQLGIAERGRTVAESRYRQLRRETDSQLKKSPHYHAAMRVLDCWRELCHPGARELEGPRLRIVIDRMKAKPPYTEDQLRHCVEGFAAFPYVISGHGRARHGTPAQKKVDVNLILGDAKHVDMGLAMYEESAQRRTEVPVAPAVTPILQLSEMGQAAVRYAEFGWSIFPVKPRSKLPATKHGLNDATRDTDRIATFWRQYPDYNIGVRCGIPSNLVVLDVDGDEGTASLRVLERQYGPLPRTASFVTPSGGQHYYFRHPPTGELRNSTGYPGPGLDTRANGGYVLITPSIAASGRMYEVDERAAVADMPDWLTAALANRPQAAFRTDYVELVREGCRKGERNDSLLKLAGHLWSHDHEADEVVELVQAVNVARCSPPLPREEVAKIVASVARMRAREALRAVMAG